MSNVERDLAETMFGREGLLLLVLRLKFVERPLLAAKRTFMSSTFQRLEETPRP